MYEEDLENDNLLFLLKFLILISNDIQNKMNRKWGRCLGVTTTEWRHIIKLHERGVHTHIFNSS